MNYGPFQAVSVLARILRGDGPGLLHDTWNASELADAAAEQGVECLVWQALDRTAGRSAELRAALDTRVRAAAAREFFAQRELVATLQSLRDAGVRALVIKGAALGYSIYEAAWQRPTIDTDILVPPEALEVAERVLGDAGYARSDELTSGELVSHQVSFERSDARGVQHAIDLHWKIVNPQMLADVLPFDDLWTDSVPVPSLGTAGRMPSLVDALILASVHRLAHHQAQDRLIWLYDLRLLASRFSEADWDALVRLAVARRVAGLCLDGLQQAHEHLGAQFPDEVGRALALAAPGEPSHLYLEGTVTRRRVLANDLVTLGSWRERLRLIREHAFPPPAYIRKRYGIKSSWLLPALYVHRLLSGAHKWIRP